MHCKIFVSQNVCILKFCQLASVSTKYKESILIFERVFHAFSALLIVLLCLFQWNRIDSNYHPSNAHEVENAPNKNADKSFVNDYQNSYYQTTSFFKKPSSIASKEKIIMVRFKKNHLTVRKHTWPSQKTYFFKKRAEFKVCEHYLSNLSQLSFKCFLQHHQSSITSFFTHQ